jgi:hypothetical protein
MRPDAAVARRFLLAGVTLVPLGIALCAVGQSDLGSWVTLGGLAALISGLHTFGRAGPDKGV